VPAVCPFSLPNFCAGIHSAAVSFCFLARLPFRQRMRPGAYTGDQCLCGFPSDSRASAEKRPLESTLSRTRNTWRGGRAPCALLNVPRPLPPVPWAAGRRPSAAGRAITSLNVCLRQFTGTAPPWDPVAERVTAAGDRRPWQKIAENRPRQSERLHVPCFSQTVLR
jgi:hypothetical protein